MKNEIINMEYGETQTKGFVNQQLVSLVDKRRTT